MTVAPILTAVLKCNKSFIHKLAVYIYKNTTETYSTEKDQQFIPFLINIFSHSKYSCQNACYESKYI